MSAEKCHERSLKQAVPLKLKKKVSEIIIQNIPLDFSDALEKTTRLRSDAKPHTDGRKRLSAA